MTGWVRGADELQVCQTDESQRRDQMGFEMVPVRKRTAGKQVAVTCCGDDDDLPVVYQRLAGIVSGGVEGKGPAKSHDLVDPRLELRRNPEVVNRGTDENHVGSLDLRDELVTEFKHLRGGIGSRIAECGDDPIFVDHRGRIGRKIALNHSAA